MLPFNAAVKIGGEVISSSQLEEARTFLNSRVPTKSGAKSVNNFSEFAEQVNFPGMRSGHPSLDYDLIKRNLPLAIEIYRENIPFLKRIHPTINFDRPQLMPPDHPPVSIPRLRKSLFAANNGNQEGFFLNKAEYAAEDSKAS